MTIFHETEHEILEKEDTILIRSDTLLKELEKSSLLEKECKVVWEAAVLEQRIRGEQQKTIEDSIRNDSNYDISVCSIMGGRREDEAKCQKACPIGVLIPEIMELVCKGEKLEALRHLIQYNPMPSITSRICPGFCQMACLRGTKDKNVEIQEFEQILGDEIEHNSDIFYIAPSGDSGKKVAVLGGNAAGLSAAYHLRRVGNHVTVYIDSCDEKGEVLCYHIEKLPFPQIEKYIENLKKMGVTMITDGKRETIPLEHYDCILDLKKGNGEWELEHFLKDIKVGYEKAKKINLDFGLKTYLEPAPFFTRVWKESEILVQEEYDYFLKKLDGWEKAILIGKRCMNCASYAAQTSIVGAAMMALETQVITEDRNIRGLDFWSLIRPYDCLKENETVIAYEIPKSGQFESGCNYVADIEKGKYPIILIYAYYIEKEKIIDLRIILAAAAPVPVRLYELEQKLRRKKLGELDKIEWESFIPVVELQNNKNRIREAKTLICQLLNELRRKKDQ